MKYDIFNLKDLPGDLKKIKERNKFYRQENHSRRHGLSSDGKVFYKTWDSDYVRGSNLPDALAAGFYDEKLIPAFQALILDEDKVCRGYLMAAMTKGSISPTLEFLQHIKEKTLKSKYFFYDFWKANIMEYAGNPCLIDLESVYPLYEYHFRIRQNEDVYQKKGYLIKNSDYREFVENLL